MTITLGSLSPTTTPPWIIGRGAYAFRNLRSGRTIINPYRWAYERYHADWATRRIRSISTMAFSKTRPQTFLVSHTCTSAVSMPLSG